MNSKVKKLIENSFCVSISEEQTLSQKENRIEFQNYIILCKKYEIPYSKSWNGASITAYYGVKSGYSLCGHKLDWKNLNSSNYFKSVQEFQNFIEKGDYPKKVQDFLEFK